MVQGLFAALVEALFYAPLRAIVRVLTRPRVRQVAPEEVRPLRHRVLREGCPFETTIWDGDDEPTTRHYLLTWAGQGLAIASVMQAPFPEGAGPARQLRGMAVDHAFQGQGLGATLLKEVQRTEDQPLWCNARERAVSFYGRHAWRGVGEPFDIPPIGPHQRMVWDPEQSAGHMPQG